MDPRLQDILYAKSIGKTKEFVYTHPEYKPRLTERLRFWYYLYQVKRGTPLAYILDEQEFCSLVFKVNKHTLIPRADTELMVEETVRILKNKADHWYIDIGTGSGCVPISVLFKLKKDGININKTTAVDISKKALKIAKMNAVKHGVNINFVQGDLFTPFLNNKLNTNNQIVITANLPYLTQEQFKSESSIWKEPRLALVADSNNGLSLYERLLKQCSTLSFSLTLLLEIDPEQTEEIKKMISNIFPNSNIEIKTDLAGRDRLVIVRNIIG